MAAPGHQLLEESLVTACRNLGKSVILQCLQQDILPPDGTTDMLSGACQALAEAILRSTRTRILEDGCITQKEILSYACRELAKLIKTQCPRGPGEMCRMRGELEYALSEVSLATKLADVINTRELVECVCKHHETGLRTVLLTACQWLINDIKALFLSEEVWRNLFGDAHFVLAALYTHLRPLLCTMIYHVHIKSNKTWQESTGSGTTSAEMPTRLRGKTEKYTIKQYKARNKKPAQTKHSSGEEKQWQTFNYADPHILKISNGNDFQSDLKRCDKGETEFMDQNHDFKMIINNRETHTSYIVALISTEMSRACDIVLKLWCTLVDYKVFACNDLYDDRVCYLITFGRFPVTPMELLRFNKSSKSAAFRADVTLREICCPNWPKDKSVIKRWFPDPRTQAMEESGDWGNQCLQIWKIGSRELEKLHPKIISIKSVESRSVSGKSDESDRVIYQKKTTGCFCFFKGNVDNISSDF